MIIKAIDETLNNPPILSDASLPNNFRNSTKPAVIAYENFNSETVARYPKRFIMTEKVLGVLSVEFYELGSSREEYYVKPMADTNIASLIKASLSAKVNVDFSFQENFSSYANKINKEFSILKRIPINLIIENVENKLMITRIMVNPERLSREDLEGLYKIIWEEYHKNNIVDKNISESSTSTTERTATPNKPKKKPSKMLEWRREFRERQDAKKSPEVEVNRTEVSHEQYLKSLEELRKRGVLI